MEAEQVQDMRQECAGRIEDGLEQLSVEEIRKHNATKYKSSKKNKKRRKLRGGFGRTLDSPENDLEFLSRLRKQGRSQVAKTKRGRGRSRNNRNRRGDYTNLDGLADLEDQPWLRDEAGERDRLRSFTFDGKVDF